MKRRLWKALLAAGGASLAIFLVLVGSFLSNPGYGPCPRPPPCGSGAGSGGSAGSACLVSTCPMYYAWAEMALLFGGLALFAAGVGLVIKGRRATPGPAPNAA